MDIKKGLESNGFGLKPGDEPVISASGIHETWGRAWPNVIARVWYEEHTGQCENSAWYKDLFSGDSTRVQKALEAEGFISDAIEHGESESQLEKWVSLKIVVKKSVDEIDLKINGQKANITDIKDVYNDTYNYDSKKYNTSNGWNGVDRLEHTLILTVPPKPKEPSEFAVAIADYQASGKVYPFTCCGC